MMEEYFGPAGPFEMAGGMATGALNRDQFEAFHKMSEDKQRSKYGQWFDLSSEEVGMFYRAYDMLSDQPGVTKADFMMAEKIFEKLGEHMMNDKMPQPCKSFRDCRGPMFEKGGCCAKAWLNGDTSRQDDMIMDMFKRKDGHGTCAPEFVSSYFDD